jgi:hypothetical protein
MRIIKVNEDTHTQTSFSANDQWQEAVYNRMHDATRRVEPLDRGESHYMGKSEDGQDLYAVGE